MEELEPTTPPIEYGDSNIVTLEGLEHVRRRPGMYIGKLGDGNHVDDGIYVLLKEVLDNCIDEYRMGAGSKIDESQKWRSGSPRLRAWYPSWQDGRCRIYDEYRW
jgi:hypothetical protein